MLPLLTRLSVCLSVWLAGYGGSSSLVMIEEEERNGDTRWESRHLLQNFYDNASDLVPEAESKNCTEPGKRSM